jgi:hypothetical protein
MQKERHILGRTLPYFYKVGGTACTHHQMCAKLPPLMRVIASMTIPVPAAGRKLETTNEVSPAPMRMPSSALFHPRKIMLTHGSMAVPTTFRTASSCRRSGRTTLPLFFLVSFPYFHLFHPDGKYADTLSFVKESKLKDPKQGCVKN